MEDKHHDGFLKGNQVSTEIPADAKDRDLVLMDLPNDLLEDIAMMTLKRIAQLMHDSQYGIPMLAIAKVHNTVTNREVSFACTELWFMRYLAKKMEVPEERLFVAYAGSVETVKNLTIGNQS